MESIIARIVEIGLEHERVAWIARHRGQEWETIFDLSQQISKLAGWLRSVSDVSADALTEKLSAVFAHDLRLRGLA
jgi:hypothetical protein